MVLSLLILANGTNGTKGSARRGGPCPSHLSFLHNLVTLSNFFKRGGEE